MDKYLSIQQPVSAEFESVKSMMYEALSSDNTLIERVVSHFLQHEGKLIRPLVTLLPAAVLGGVTKNTLHSAVAIELLHSASLIHDDVVDDSPRRRNLPTINAKWNNKIAVLAGDYFVSAALRSAAATQDIRVIEVLSEVSVELTDGELAQLNATPAELMLEETYMRIVSKKTASLFAASMRLGALSVEASEEDIALFTSLGRSLGVVFQIRDDIFDYYPDNESGKPAGTDMIDGKVTLPLILALHSAPLTEATCIAIRVEEGNITPQDVEQFVSFTHAHGGVESAFRYMYQLKEQAKEMLRHLPQTAVKESFISLFDFAIERTK